METTFAIYSMYTDDYSQTFDFYVIKSCPSN